MIIVEVAYARFGQQVLIALSVPAQTTVLGAIEQSGILSRFPEINLQQNRVGIFSKIVALSELLKAGDRIEIYRPLQVDPKQARLLRAARSRKR